MTLNRLIIPPWRDHWFKSNPCYQFQARWKFHRAFLWRDFMSIETSLRIFPPDWTQPMPLRDFFGNDQPIEVDLGCGKGRFLLAHATAHPNVNFFGVDRMLRRIRKVDNKARRQALSNIRLMRMEAYYATTYLLPPASIATYYIFFPDPWPKKRHHEHRLFNSRFMDALHRTLTPGGGVHFATDHLPYFAEVCALIRADRRFAEIPPFVPEPEEQTDFERYYIGRTPIGRFSFRKT
ncbi:MAG: tRNA (guanosine(46)-N7)-methyltransferase TrmB [Verrucomicrobia bacterium]|nr:MAG: tRNA (guanosine(46)-N7)-methyltransferase TrmB [Verrucomicrobiota bacterium]